MHKLLSKQIKRHYPAVKLPEELTPLLQSISDAYEDFDGQQLLLERSLELVSEELSETNQQLRQKLAQLEDTYQQLGQSLAVLDSIFDATDEAILAFDNKNRLIRLNAMAKDFFGIDRVNSMYGNCSILRVFYRELNMPVELIRQLKRLAVEPESRILGILSLRDRRLFEYHSAPQMINGKSVGRVWCFRNVTELKKNEAMVQYQAFHDALTELPNRLLLVERLNHAISLSHSQKEMLAVLFIDLDHFKKVNDTAGHQLGDELLIEVSGRIKSCLRDHDTLARFGGDEFVVLLENIKGHGAATKTSQRIIEILQRPFEVGGNIFHISSSIGISIYPRDDSDPEALIRKADLAMYHAKQNGRSNFEFFDTPLERIAHFQLELENKLRQAFDNEELEIYYQPQVNLKNQSVTKMEALLRWFPINENPISPADFISVAERAGFIDDIGRWVIERVCKQIKAWKNSGFENVKVSVNLSAAQFSAGTLISQIKQIYQEQGIEGHHLEFEITESMLVEDLPKVSSVLSDIRALNSTVAIDDFGTGYSSLKYLQVLPLDTIKIDRSFIQVLSNNCGDQSIVNAIISLGHSLNLRVVAEGVEDKSAVEYLLKQGCDYIQGFYFYKPMPAAEMTLRLKENLSKSNDREPD